MENGRLQNEKVPSKRTFKKVIVTDIKKKKKIKNYGVSIYNYFLQAFQ